MKDNNSAIEILLATYNGEKYIDQQINSIINQTYTNWKILFRDDGSTDNTVRIIEKFIEAYPDKMMLVIDKEKNLGASGNFSRLLESSQSDYTMFCDQDDVWLPDKIKLTLEKMRELESSTPKETPLLVHTDLEIVDQDLITISKSMFEFQNLDKHSNSINKMLVQNNITGCTVMINKNLRNISKPIPKDIIMHDWWIALVASVFGEIGFVNGQTIKYRQHGSNDTGAKGYSIKYILERIKSIKKMYAVVYKNIRQANTFYKRYSTKFEAEKKEKVQAYATILEKSAIQRLIIIRKNKFSKQGELRNLGFWFVLSTIKNK